MAKLSLHFSISNINLLLKSYILIADNIYRKHSMNFTFQFTKKERLSIEAKIFSSIISPYTLHYF
ncbi:hypothetical protein EQH17_01750 [Streptococcus pneumoniae]|nr:hypothetical protein SPAR160_0319 [Streptococcus pneumoniae GA58581]MDA5253372.1 hypothetical protein [Streptococcus pneumoniae]MDA5266616.1 hypothetical protein [Streptococcus pneumoniae]PAV96193.1 hypothetical protein CJ013_09750 [Streptococcus pneumoniae]UKP67693.1 hypothetical protein EQH18_01780 [Streptococcus pneumoniae]